MDYPLIDRELRRRERSRRTYFLRFAVGAVALIYLVFFGIYESYTANAPERIGNALTAIGSAFQFAAAMFLPLLLSADLVAREKQERTLGLLLLADPTGFGVYGAKFLSAFLPTALLILAALPVLAIAAPFGGIEVSSLAVSTLLYLAAAFAVTALGMLASVYAWQPGPAFFLGFFAVLALTLLLRVAPSYVPTPQLNPIAIAWSTRRGGIDPNWWPVALGTLAFGALLITAGWRLLPRMAHDKPIPRRSLAEIFRGQRQARAIHARRDPAEQLLARRLGGWSASIRPWPLRVLASIGLIAMAFMTCVGPILLVVLIAWDVLSALKTGRETGAIDDVILTAENSESIGKWIYKSQARRSIFYLPAMIFAGGLGSSLFVFMLPIAFFTSAGPTMDIVGIVAVGGIALTLAIIFALVQLRFIVALCCRSFTREFRGKRGSIAYVVLSYIAAVLLFSFVTFLLAAVTPAPENIKAILLIFVVLLILIAIQRAIAQRFAQTFEEKF